MGKGPNYDTEVIKHFVRKRSWIKPFKRAYNRAERDFKGKKRDERFKYLTFCAKNAIDVFLLEKEGLLYRDPETKRLINVYFCEEVDEDFIKIEQLLGSNNQGFFGNFGKLLFNNFAICENEDEEEFKEVEDEEERQRIRLKESQEKLTNSFPFDAINLDVYGNAFPESDDRYSEQCKIFSKILELQKNTINTKVSKFVLYLTLWTPVRDHQINPNALTELNGALWENMKYKFFKEQINNKYGTSTPDKLDVHIRYTLGFLKKVILRDAYTHGWNVKLEDLCCYDRLYQKKNEPYKMSCYVLEFERKAELDNKKVDFHGAIPQAVESSYQEEINKFIKSFPIDVPNENEIEQDIKDDLREIVKFRDDFLKSIENIS